MLGVALFAAGLGFAAGLMVAPASGRETRRRLRMRLEDEASHLRRRMEDEAEHLRRRGKHALEDVGDYVDDRIEAGRRVAGRIRQR
jgi:gas vesicle protein